MPYKDVDGNDVDGNGRAFPSTPPPPPDEASRGDVERDAVNHSRDAVPELDGLDSSCEGFAEFLEMKRRCYLSYLAGSSRRSLTKEGWIKIYTAAMNAYSENLNIDDALRAVRDALTQKGEEG